MVHRSGHDLDRLERRLAETYAALPAPEFGPGWDAKVMRDIRLKAAASAGKGIGWVELHVWRTAALATAFALVFAGSLFLYSGMEKGELTAFLSEELEPAPSLLE